MPRRSERSPSASNRRAGAKRPPPPRRSSARFPDSILLEPVTRANRRDAVAYAARRPYENAFLQWMLEGGHGASPRDDLLLHRDYRGRVTGLVYFGAQLVLAADDDAALDAFAIEARKHRGLRSFVGPKEAVDGIWARVRSWHVAPQIVRESQPLYVLARGSLREVAPDVEARRAREDEAELVAENSAQMIVGELGYDPRVARSAFVSVVRRAIAAGQWWVWIVDGMLRFQCNIGPHTAATAQIQGVWTPPSARGHGWATLGFAAIARRLLASEPTLSLYVNDFNQPAIALYERLGFTQAGTFATYLFP